MDKDNICMITDITDEGLGVGKYNGKILFIPNSLPLDIVKFKITLQKKNYAFAEIVKIIKSSPFKKEIKCKYFPKCGGCDLLHMKYENQLQWKKDHFKEILKRISGIELKKNINIYGMDKPFYYRDKIQFPVHFKKGKIQIGFYERKSHELIGIKDCLLQPEICNEIIKKIPSILTKYKITPYNERKNSGYLRHIIIRYSFSTKKIMIIFAINSKSPDKLKKIIPDLLKMFSGIISVHYTTNTKVTNRVAGYNSISIYEKSRLFEKIGKIKYKISPLSFFQINPVQAKVLYDKISEFLGNSKKDNIVDLYCGTGSISLYIAHKCKNVTGFETITSSVKDACFNAKLNKIKNYEFVKANLDKEIINLNDFSKIIIDPPRKGISDILIKSILNSNAKEIIYVSCKPSTFARDVKLISTKYKISDIALVDMFPQTTHCEVVAKLKKI